jgi:hypothetical protein
MWSTVAAISIAAGGAGAAAVRGRRVDTREAVPSAA